jgi:hypothetical protein
MTVETNNSDFGKRSKYVSDLLGYIAAGLYSGSAFLYLWTGYSLAGGLYLLTTLYFVVMSSVMIYHMLNIDRATDKLQQALYSSVSEALKIDFSFLFYHWLLLVGLILPFVMPHAGPLSQSFAIIVGLLEIIMLATAKTLYNRTKKEQP